MVSSFFTAIDSFITPHAQREQGKVLVSSYLYHTMSSVSVGIYRDIFHTLFTASYKIIHTFVMSISGWYDSLYTSVGYALQYNSLVCHYPLASPRG